MAYLLATTENKVRWYKIDLLSDEQEYEILDVLDLTKVNSFGDKASAKNAAIEAGLKTWRYVKFSA